MIPELDDVMGLIVKEAAEVARFPSLLEVEDLIQEGVIVYLVARRKFVGDRGAKFTTFLVFLLKQKLRQRSMELPRSSREDGAEFPEKAWEQRWLADIDLSPAARRVLRLARTMDRWARVRKKRTSQTSMRTLIRERLGLTRERMSKIEAELREALVAL